MSFDTEEPRETGLIDLNNRIAERLRILKPVCEPANVLVKYAKIVPGRGNRSWRHFTELSSAQIPGGASDDPERGAVHAQP